VTSVPSTMPSPPSLTPRRRRLGAAPTTALIAFSSVGLLVVTGTAHAATPISLGAADSFAVLANTAITNTGATTITGDIGASSNSITGPGTIVLTPPSQNHGNDAATGDAHGGLTAAFTAAGAQGMGADVGTASLSLQSQPMQPGVYSSASDLDLTGQITLDGGGSYDSVFIFRAGQALTTAPASEVLLTGGAQACNVFWQVGSSATLGAASAFTGNILANISISLDPAASVDGRLLASTGAVTLINNVITRSECKTGSVPVSSPPVSAPPVGTPPTDGADTAQASAAPSSAGRGGSGAGRTTYGQVGRVPVGSVDTGDGSTS
jgi:hypothetical protein